MLESQLTWGKTIEFAELQHQMPVWKPIDVIILRKALRTASAKAALFT